MAKRRVFGRRQFAVDSEIWHVELREDGLHIHQKSKQTEWHFPPEELAMMCHGQYAFPFIRETGKAKHEVDASKQTTILSGVQKIGLVSFRPDGSVVHEGGEQPPKDVQDGGSGLDTPTDGPVETYNEGPGG